MALPHKAETIWEPVIGLEVHAELLTASKMFCGCAVAPDVAAQPNTRVCPVCMALPGSLPVINARAVEYTIRSGLALNCAIGEFNIFARKNYFYPDLPKGYQISQYEYPLCREGWIEIEPQPGQVERIRIRRVHLEEDTAKLIHVDGASLVDLNRAGVPLMEIVSEPDMRSAQAAKTYATRLHALLRYIGVTSGDMEKGAIRFEANISIRPAGSAQLNTRTEIKNLNSFRALVRAAEYEIARQIRVVESGGTIEQETLGWSEERGQTYTQRSKEYAEDYRYFPEPDLLPLQVSRQEVERIRADLPELPDARRDRLMSTYGLSRYDAGLLTAERAVAGYYEEAAAGLEPGPAKLLANWITGDLFRLMNETGAGIERILVRPAGLLALVKLVSDGRLNRNTAKAVLEEMFATGEPPAAIAERKGWVQVSDQDELSRIVNQVLDAYPGPVGEYLAGKEPVFKWLLGQVMKAARGQANPQVATRVLQAALDRRRAPIQ